MSIELILLSQDKICDHSVLAWCRYQLSTQAYLGRFTSSSWAPVIDYVVPKGVVAQAVGCCGSLLYANTYTDLVCVSTYLDSCDF